MSEAIAWLDLVSSFADLVTRSPGVWVRPDLTMNGEMVIKDGRHPLVQNATNETMVPNDVHMEQTANFNIVTGANGVRLRKAAREIRSDTNSHPALTSFLCASPIPFAERQEHVFAYDRRCVHPCAHRMLRAFDLRLHSNHRSDSHSSVAAQTFAVRAVMLRASISSLPLLLLCVC